MQRTFLFDWPYLALAIGLLGGAAAIIRRRPRDVSWLVCLMLPMYMVHQFEEHGIDLYGRRYHFLVEICTTLGHPSIQRCPADPWFIAAVNVGAVWIAGLTAIAWRERNPLVGLCAFGIPLVNGFAHLVPALRHGAYNSGLATAIFFFLPLSLYVIKTAIDENVIARDQVPIVIATGALVHVILFGALLGFERGIISRSVMLAIEVGNGFIPLSAASLVRLRSRFV